MSVVQLYVNESINMITINDTIKTNKNGALCDIFPPSMCLCFNVYDHVIGNNYSVFNTLARFYDVHLE